MCGSVMSHTFPVVAATGNFVHLCSFSFQWYFQLTHWARWRRAAGMLSSQTSRGTGLRGARSNAALPLRREVVLAAEGLIVEKQDGIMVWTPFCCPLLPYLVGSASGPFRFQVHGHRRRWRRRFVFARPPI